MRKRKGEGGEIEEYKDEEKREREIGKADRQTETHRHT